MVSASIPDIGYFLHGPLAIIPLEKIEKLNSGRLDNMLNDCEEMHDIGEVS